MKGWPMTSATMMTIGKIMTKNVIATRMDDYASQVLLQILSGQYSGMPVIDSEKRVVGVISEFDLLKAIRKGLSLEEVPVKDLMTKEPITADSNASPESVIDVMIAKNIIRLPVVQDGKLVGVISRSDILMAYYHSDFLIKFS